MGTRNRTELSREFKNPPPTNSGEFDQPASAQIAPEFLKGFNPPRGERFASPLVTQNVRPAATGLAGILRSTGVRITQIFLGRRDIEFKESGPLVKINENDEWVIPVPVKTLPPRNVLVDTRGRVLENTEKLSETQLKALQSRFRIKIITPKLEHYAAAIHAGYHVLQPLTQILVRTLDSDSHLYFVNFQPGANGQWPALLYEARSGSLFIYNGNNYSFG